jgi:hypothetical protein
MMRLQRFTAYAIQDDHSTRSAANNGISSPPASRSIARADNDEPLEDNSGRLSSRREEAFLRIDPRADITESRTAREQTVCKRCLPRRSLAEDFGKPADGNSTRPEGSV